MRKLLELEVLEIYWNGRSATEVASWYGVSEATVRKIRTGRTWRHVTKHGEVYLPQGQVEIEGDGFDDQDGAEA